MLLKCFFILYILIFPIIVKAQYDVKTYIPIQAYSYIPEVVKQSYNYLPSLNNNLHYFGGLIEHESCINLIHNRCWNAKSRLKTSREEGAGLGQLTRTYKPDGSIRFDIIQELKNKHKELEDLSWNNVYNRPDLQIRAIVLLWRSSYNSLSTVSDVHERISMADASYNGGLGGLQQERRACKMAKDCNPNKWFNNVEKYCLKSKKILYSNRNACDINRHHVTDVMKIRMSKYQPLFKKELNSISGDILEIKAYDYFDFPSWIESKIRGKSLPEVVKNKVVLNI